MAEPVVRLTVNLTPEVAEKLERLAERLGTNKTTALHEAILTSELLQEKVDQGNTVLLKDTKNRLQEVHLRTRRS